MSRVALTAAASSPHMMSFNSILSEMAFKILVMSDTQDKKKRNKHLFSSQNWSTNHGRENS
jgi:hypothetical protein